MGKRIITGKLINKPLKEKFPMYGLYEEGFQLSKYEFSVLKRGRPRLDNWFSDFRAVVAGYLILIGAKTFLAMTRGVGLSMKSVDILDVLGLVLSILVVFVLWVGSRRVKTPERDEREKLIGEIERHFIYMPKREIYLKRDM